MGETTVSRPSLTQGHVHSSPTRRGLWTLENDPDGLVGMSVRKESCNGPSVRVPEGGFPKSGETRVGEVRPS